MSKNLGALEAGALNAWTPLQQAALYRIHAAKQDEADDLTKLKEYEEGDKAKAKSDKIRPEAIQAGQIVDDLVKKWCEPLYEFLDLFAPPHVSIVPLILLHIGFWYTAPSHFRFLTPYFLLYILPGISTIQSIFNRKHRADWQAYWVELAALEYAELVLFKDTSRSLVWWPKIKAILFISTYCFTGSEERPDHRGRPVKTPIFGATAIIRRFLPGLPKEKDKGKGEEHDRDKDKNKEKEKARENGKDRAKAKASSSSRSK